MTHNASTARLQTRLEKLELEHLRAVVAAQGEEIERLRGELVYSESCAEMWQRDHDNLSDHLANGTADGRSIGLTKSGELIVLRSAA